MSIYVEYAIIDNLVINFVLLGFLFKTIKHKLVLWKMAVCITVGMLFACVVPLASMGLLTIFNPKTFYVAIVVLMATKVFVTVMFLCVMSGLIKFMCMRQAVTTHLRDCIITYKGKEYKTKGYLDTGNRLVDPESNAPVVIISLKLYLKMFPVINGHYINFSTVDKSDAKMFVFAPAKFEIIDNKQKISHDNVRLGLSYKSFRDSIKYDALLNVNLV
ncbi:MAG: sigma-E processing peptidase SpoIIGA [Christensenellaceae bacterium]|jgi:hypothetical protein|nr:sigma-E processing peptidase SpoIIGA [Christensenellaceae bacterium]